MVSSHDGTSLCKFVHASITSYIYIRYKYSPSTLTSNSPPSTFFPQRQKYQNSPVRQISNKCENDCSVLHHALDSDRIFVNIWQNPTAPETYVSLL